MNLTQQNILKSTIALAAFSIIMAFYFKFEKINASIDLINAKLDRVQKNYDFGLYK